MKLLIITLSICFLLIGSAECISDSYLSGVKFKIIEDRTGNPLKNHYIEIYRFAYDVHFNSKESNFYITSVTTDSQGVFSLDLSKIDTQEIVIQPGKPYNIVIFDRSSDLAHTKSIDHIRVTGNGGNAIYNLKNKIVQIIPFHPDYGNKRIESYKEILLTTTKIIEK